MDNNDDITLTPTQRIEVTSDQLLPVIAKIEQAVDGEQLETVFIAILAIAIINQYPQMSDDQLSKGIDRIALNICQMAQEYEFENKLAARADESQEKLSTN